MSQTEEKREGFYLSEDGEWIPDGWRSTVIDDLKKPEKGAISIGPFGSRMKSDCYTMEGVPVLRGNNITDGRNFTSEFVYVSSEKADELKGCVVRSGDLIFPHRGAIGEVGIVQKEQEFVMSSSLMKLSPDLSQASSEFLFYFFRSHQGRGKLLENASQVGTPGIGQPLSSLKSIEIKLPQLPEQKAIASVLGSLDDKIELLREQNETLEALAQTLFKRWFIDFNFPDENGNPYKDSGGTMIPSELGEIPEGWNVGDFSNDGFNIIMGQSPSGSSYNEDLEGMLFYQGRAEFGWRFPTPRLFTTEPKRIAEKGSILLSVRAPVGDINLAMSKCCIGRGLCSLSHSFPSYGLYKIKSLEVFFNQYNQEGTVFGSISKKDFERNELIIPNNDMAKDFNKIGQPLDSKIKSNTQQIQTLTHLRDTLLPKLMKGEIRI